MSAKVVPAPEDTDPQANLRNEHKVMTPNLPRVPGVRAPYYNLSLAQEVFSATKRKAAPPD